jgi:hypothetical protein
MPSKFDFISPDILLREVDLSQVPPEPENEGLLVIGQAPKGPAMKPIRVKDNVALKEVFGAPYSGDTNGDIFRSGNKSNPTYGLFAAQAWLASNTSPVTFIRLAGEETGSGFTSKAGWDLGGVSHATTAADVKAAYGLWMVPSHSAGTAQGTLAAVFYTQGAAMTLSGTVAGTSDTTSSVGTMIESGGPDGGFKIQVYDGSTTEDISFNMTPGSSSFVRKAFNTDPQKLIGGQKAETKKYFLGESFETAIKDTVLSVSSSAGDVYGMLLPLAQEDSTGNSWLSHINSVEASKTGWFIGNDPSPTIDTGSFSADNMTKLFRFHSLIEGSQFEKQYAIRLRIVGLGQTDNPYTTFTVDVFDIKAGTPVENFSCNLNPNSENYIAKKIGDQVITYNSSKEKFITTGEFPIKSDYIRVEMSGLEYADDVIPFGFYGPVRPKAWQVAGHGTPADIPTALDSGAGATYVAAGTGSLIYGGHSTVGWANYQVEASSSFTWPSLSLTDESGIYTKNSYFGVRHQQDSGSAYPTNQVYASNALDYVDLIRELPDTEEHDATTTYTEHSFIFTLDELRKDTNGKYYYESGSHANGDAWTANSGSASLIETEKVNKLIAPFMGGKDGVDIRNVDPFSSDRVLDAGTINNDYAMAAVNKAIEIAKDSETIKYDVVCMPGVHKQSFVNQLVGNTEERGDALAIVDIPSGFQSTLEYNAATAGSVDNVVNNIKEQNYNSSYAATYYPEVKLQILNGSRLTVPASIAGVGAIASSEAASGAPWFAPAGFNRGGLSNLGGPTGPKVVGVSETLNKADRDELYQVNINPIANFPGEGPVVFGQKTLQQTPSALDRINVRRLMIYLKKNIGEVARTILFDNNVNATWNRFKAGANPILSDAKSRFGVAEYKLVLDETTTTPDYVDRNIMYAQVYIKPAYAIEFIAIDFNITRSGIEF